MLDDQCPRVVETRELATETTLEDVLARNLSTHGVMHAHAPTWRLQPRAACTASALSTLPNYVFYNVVDLPEGCSPPLRGRARICPAALTAVLRLVTPFTRSSCSSVVRARHVEGVQRRTGPRVQSGPPREKPLLLSTARSAKWRVAVRAWVVKCVPWERASE